MWRGSRRPLTPCWDGGRAEPAPVGAWPSGIRWSDTSGRRSRCTKRFARRPDDEGDAPCASGGRFVIRSPMSSPGRIGSGVGLAFGTSGWRAVIADQFTFANVRLVARAIADYLADQGLHGRPVIVGYDTRFLSDRFAREAAAVLAERGWTVLLTVRDVPTPVVSHAILDRRAAGGINITASHNPPEYNGVKFSPAWGGPALPETTPSIKDRIIALGGEPGNSGATRSGEPTGSIEPFDPSDAYLAHLLTIIDFPVIRAAKLRVAVDVLYGTARGYLDALLKAEGCDVTVLHDQRDPLFGGSAPDPSERRLTELAALMREGRYHLGLATDGGGGPLRGAGAGRAA